MYPLAVYPSRRSASSFALSGCGTDTMNRTILMPITSFRCLMPSC
jgi:hypothetical protein